MSRVDDFHNAAWAVAVNPKTAFPATTPTQPPISTMGLSGISVTIRPNSGTVNGQYKLQVTDFGPDAKNPPKDSDWVDVPNSTQPMAAGVISSTINWDLIAIDSAWLRVVFVDNSSTSPVVDAAICGRMRP